MPQVDCFFRGMPHQRRKRRQHRCKHGTKPPMPQVDFFLDMASKEARCPRLIVFLVGRSVGGGNVADATGNAEPNHQHCRWIVFFGRGIVGGQQCRRLIVFLEGRGIKVAKTEPNHKHHRLIVFLGGRPATPHLGGGRGIGGGNIANAAGMRSQTTNAAGRFLFLDVALKEANNATG